ncbi:ComEC/Rec2 family competence protein [Wenyingzhuangia aestuarii]|uniref:ComEC/Rec2 family competence protein n=1 Tax=Wenyingzhuangia aestuarii TaxID=1647582 RepID=UPI00143B4299|nr:ComEC/Rec2 family competence protein [Wenyingzhuangia aestuarii]NJB83803.1 competence protein ComEC [Wenyingzhuangia aestuarii]
MKLLYSYVPFQVLIGVLLGILFPNSSTVVFVLGLSLLVLSILLILLNNAFKNYFVLSALILLGLLSVWYSKDLNNDLKKESHYSYSDSKPATLQLTIVKQLKSSEKLFRYYARVDGVNSKASSGTILVEVSKDSVSLNRLYIGDEFVCKTKIRPINLPSSPYDFDYRNYLALKKVYGKIRLKNFIKTGSSTSWLLKLQNYRSGVVAKLQASVLSKESKELLMAMLLGDKEHLSKEMQQSFANAGVVHLIAISGMHVGVLYFLLFYTFGFVKSFRYGNYIHVFTVVICLWGFAVFSGLSSSVVRSVTMFSFIILAKLKRKRGLLLEPIVSSMLLLLVLKPNYLFDVGFQLSYTAVISIVVFYPLLTQNIRLKNKIVKYFVDVVIVSVVAQLGVLPITLYYFHQLPLQFLMANFIAVSLLPLVLYGGFLVLMKILLLEQFTFIEAYFDVFVKLYIQVIDYFSSLEFLILKDISITSIHVYAYYILLFLIWKLFQKQTYKNVGLLLMGILSFQFYHFYHQYKIHQKEELVIYNDYRNNTITLKNKEQLFVFSDTIYLPTIHQNVLYNNIKKQKKVASKIIEFKKASYLIVDESYAYYSINKKGMNLILMNNPKINIARLVKELSPNLVIIGAGNYTNHVQKWKSTCRKLQVLCYDVNLQGAYVVN